MTKLRQEYVAHKKNEDRLITEAAVNWLESNVFIINEKIDRRSVDKLVSSIAKFEETFSPFETKVPTITTIIDGCEDNLQMVLTGKAGNKKTSEVLEYLSYVYNSFSTFFAKDMPVILKARLFKIARENPEIRLDSLTRGGFNAEAAMKAFAHGITPSAEEKKLIGKILKSKSIPNIDAKQIASELMSLSYNDLIELTQVGKVPLTTTPKTLDEEDVIVSESYLNEARKILTEASVEEVGQQLGTLKSIVAKLNSPKLTKSINNLHSKLLAFEASPAGDKLKQQIKQSTAKDAALADIFKTPGGKLTKQANMAIELFTALGNEWPKIKTFIDKDQPTQQDLVSIQRILTKAASGGLLKKAGQAFGISTPPFPGLEPQTVISILTDDPQVNEQVNNSQPEQFGKTTEMPAVTKDDVIGKKLANLKTAMTALNQFATNSATSSTQPSTGSSSTQGGTSSTQQTTSTTPTTGTREEPLTSGSSSSVVDDVMKVMGASKPSTKQTLGQAISAIEKAGYKITK